MTTYILAASLLCLLAIALYLWWRDSRAPPPPQMPKEWPLAPRLLVNSKERKIWMWLAKVMYDQQIMVKLPVTRFTAPARRDEAEQWYALLNRVYCTFTVCDLDGRVIGCVDVPGHAGLSMSNQTLKHGLLSQCGIPYWVVEPDNLPHMRQIRTAFLGESAARADEQEPMGSRLKDVADHLHAAVSRQRTVKDHAEQKARGFEPTVLQTDGPLSEGWEQNSFMAPLDSRRAELRGDAEKHS
jgi:hypothetical protein